MYRTCVGLYIRLAISELAISEDQALHDQAARPHKAENLELLSTPNENVSVHRKPLARSQVENFALFSHRHMGM